MKNLARHAILGCNTVPPSVPLPIIKNLGAAFCEVATSNLTGAKLTPKGKLPAPGGKQAVKKKTQSSPSEDGPKNKHYYRTDIHCRYHHCRISLNRQ
jgi:hypothetical protein